MERISVNGFGERIERIREVAWLGEGADDCGVSPKRLGRFCETPEVAATIAKSQQGDFAQPAAAGWPFADAAAFQPPVTGWTIGKDGYVNSADR